MGAKSSARKTYIFSISLAALVFCFMQMFRKWLASSQLLTIFGGYLGSLLFTLLVISVGNVEVDVFGPRFQSKLFPEVTICLLLAMATSAIVHRVSISACFIFSVISLHFINKISKQKYTNSPPNVSVPTKKKK